MADRPSNKRQPGEKQEPPPPDPKRRPVDTLVGDSAAGENSSYIVEPPRPVTSVSPPPVHGAPRPAPPPTRAPASSKPNRQERPGRSGSSVPSFAFEPASEPKDARSDDPASSAGTTGPADPTNYVTGHPAATPESGPDSIPSSPDWGESGAGSGQAGPESSQSGSDWGQSVVASASPDPNAAPPGTAPTLFSNQPPAANTGQDYVTYVSNAIHQLYQEVSDQLVDSPTVAEYCMKLLHQARDAYGKGDYPTAEFYVESVYAKMKRSARSMQLSHSPVVFLLWFWELIMFGFCAALIVLTYINDLTVFALPIAPEFVVLARAVAWGGLGGVVGAMYNLPWFVQYREFDPAYSMNYFSRPLQGLVIGGLVFLISQAGIFAGNIIIPGVSGANGSGEIPVGPVFLYVLAALAGFKQEYVYEFLDNILKSIFHLPGLPSALTMPTPTATTSSSLPMSDQ